MKSSLSDSEVVGTAIRSGDAVVLSHTQLASAYWRLRVQEPYIAAHAQPGQFVHILPLVGATDPLLRRAFSICRSDSQSIDIIYRVDGKGTALLSRVREGETLDILGPLGQPFQVQNGTAILAGGGVGVPPLLFLARRLLESGALTVASSPDSAITAMVGARTRGDLIGVNDFLDMGIEPQIATDDGSQGHAGLITDLLERRLQSLASISADSIKDEAETSATVYACGPWPMLRAVAKTCAAFGVPCQVSLEENMPCGIGVCNGCVVPVLQAGDEYGRFRRICVEGPVLWSHEVDWEFTAGHSI